MLQTHVTQIDGTPVRFALTGQGPPLLLIHGLAGSWNWWQRNVPALAQSHSVYLIDLPGFGCMRAHSQGFALDAAPSWIRAFLHTLDIRRPSIVGHSMGGTIALSFAAQWPDEVDRLALAAPALGLPRKTVVGNVLPLVAACRYADPRFYPTLLRDALRTGITTLYRAANMLVTAKEPTALTQVTTPTLLLWGEHDPLVPLDIGRGLRKSLPASRLHIIPGAGHVGMFDRPNEFNDLVLRFLSGEAVGE